jgi:hypothetical protein
MKKFDYQGAKNAGYTDDEINSFISKQHPNFDFKSALQAGYTSEEINNFLNEQKPKDSILKQTVKKTGRLGTQYALGAAESAALPFELATIPESSKYKQLINYRENLFSDIENLQQQKSLGNWNDEDESFLQNLIEQAKNPELSEKYLQTEPLGIQQITEKITGLNLHPKGLVEKTARWTSFIKNPKNIFQSGLKLKDVIKTIAPSGKESLRGLGAGAALQLAEEGDYGPIGTMTAAVIGDVLGGGIKEIGKSALNIAKQPKKSLAELAAQFTKKDKLAVQKNLIQTFRQHGIQADLGTITDNNVIKAMQARIAQSGLTGDALDKFKQNLSDKIISQYKQIADTLGQNRFSSGFEAGSSMQETIKKLRDIDLNEARQYYTQARSLAKKPNALVDASNTIQAIDNLEKNLKPGSFKSTEQKSVLNILEDLKNDVMVAGQPKLARVEDLINNKIALNDVINYEIQGGAKQLLKGLVKELDKSILRYGKQDPQFAKSYVNANVKFSDHAKTFRNKRINQILMSQDASNLMSKMNTTQGIKDIEKSLSVTAEGKKLFGDLKRFKLDEIVGKTLEDSLTKQVKYGSFASLTNKAKNMEMFKALLSPAAANRLTKLSNLTGKVADTMQKFYNASKTASTSIDAAFLVKAFSDFMNLLSGNPWPLTKSAGVFGSVRIFSKLLTDEKFLKLVEDAIITGQTNNYKKLLPIMEELQSAFQASLNEFKNKKKQQNIESI